MKTQHTPGPWSAFIGEDRKTISVCIGPTMNGQTPCIVNWTGFDSCGLPMRQRKANARLIAAAPDLLEALRWAARALDHDHPAAIKARAAIAKATGEQK